VFKAHTLLYHSTLGLRVIERRRREDAFTLNLRSTNSGLGVRIVWLVESVRTLSVESREWEDIFFFFFFFTLEEAFTLNAPSTSSGLGVRIVWLVESVMTLSSSSSSSSLLLSSLELSDAKVYEP